ncbi:Hypothetical protein I595_1885 [Croceitalea dokdonensis DOKDO 023]|uniref:Uncharacterized protein n=1 Tax=Croceitalea dokdonensis DOKDO 023 TaxID=1300341 RepID=A0A0P7AW95_9FLAO|nr:hypothetical protein [Croceitalea dokdonensis]KPM32235.1 Hypothetical protein I595_1885 [Croceitalea dokdonensis DOKDO 023]
MGKSINSKTNLFGVKNTPVLSSIKALQGDLLKRTTNGTEIRYFSITLKLFRKTAVFRECRNVHSLTIS